MLRVAVTAMFAGWAALHLRVLDGVIGIRLPALLEPAGWLSKPAECAMPNKGPYIVTAVRVLGDILRRMQPHHERKNSMSRKLHLAVAFHPGA
jgi:pyruvate kinase